VYVISYRFYAAWIATKLLIIDPTHHASRMLPAILMPHRYREGSISAVTNKQNGRACVAVADLFTQGNSSRNELHATGGVRISATVEILWLFTGSNSV